MPERLVVSDTSPLLYLHQVRQLVLLRRLFETVVVPRAVALELSVGAEGGFDVPNLAAISWLQVKSPPETERVPTFVDLGPGESEVLAFGLSAPEALLLLDDGRAREIAARSALSFTGTLGLLVRAKQRGILAQVAPVLDALQRTTMRLSEELLQWALDEAGEQP